MILLLAITVILLLDQPSKMECYFDGTDPWINCPDCKGSGYVDLGRGDTIECPCTIKWR